MVLPAVIEALRSISGPLVQPLFLPLLYWTIQNLAVIISGWANADRIQDEKDSRNLRSSRAYDFIIVGAGSAGCLLANRLSRHYSVLLLEAGGEPNPLQFIPGFSLFLINQEHLDWRYRTLPQKYGSLTSINQESLWSSGLGLGGSGNSNLMVHLRGHKEDFENWARITGDPQWSWNGVREFFSLHEEYDIPGDHLNHGYRGDLRIEVPDQIGNAYAFIKAGGELGYPNLDLNAPFKQGFDVARYPIKRGVRQAPYKAFLEPIRSRASLTIVKFAMVTKVLIQGNNVAYGVEYDKHGRSHIAHATKEVILSAGVVGTPKLLMLSGIGPKHHLEELNIPVKADLPVGKNLQDHFASYLGPFFIRQGSGFFIDRDLTASQMVKYFAFGKGVLTTTSCEAVGIVSSEIAKARGEGDWPDLGLFSLSFTNFRLGTRVLSLGFNLKQDVLNKYMQNDIGRDSLYVIVQNSRPLSRGFIKLGGKSAYDRPIIDPNYLGDPGNIDLKVLIDGVKKTMILMENTTSMGQRLGARFTNTRFPGCEHLPFRTDLYWECFVRRFSMAGLHPVGSAPMGSVVDTDLRVYGVKNLRVVDASIQPVIVNAETQATVLMTAEKASDMISRHWKQSLLPSFPSNHLNGKLHPLLSIFGRGLLLHPHS